MTPVDFRLATYFFDNSNKCTLCERIVTGSFGRARHLIMHVDKKELLCKPAGPRRGQNVRFAVPPYRNYGRPHACRACGKACDMEQCDGNHKCTSCHGDYIQFTDVSVPPVKSKQLPRLGKDDITSLRMCLRDISDARIRLSEQVVQIENKLSNINREILEINRKFLKAKDILQME